MEPVGALGLPAALIGGLRLELFGSYQRAVVEKTFVFAADYARRLLVGPCPAVLRRWIDRYHPWSEPNPLLRDQEGVERHAGHMVPVSFVTLHGQCVLAAAEFAVAHCGEGMPTVAAVRQLADVAEEAALVLQQLHGLDEVVAVLVVGGVAPALHLSTSSRRLSSG